MMYRVWFRTGEPKSQLITNVKSVEITNYVLYIQQTDGTTYEYSLNEVEKLLLVSAGL